MEQKKYKRKFGDRPDGRKIRSLDPLNKVSSYIMAKRNDACNLFETSIDIENVEKYIKKKRAEGLKGFGILHVMLAAYVKTVAKRPGINRFISGQKIYARNDIQIMLTIKKELKLDAQETVIKGIFSPSDSPEDIYHTFIKLVEDNKKEGDGNSLDSVARILNYIPGLFLKFTVWLLNLMDYFGILPKFLLKVSPFHGSFYITSMGSLGIPAIYHHLYNFGNVPIFCSYSAKRNQYVLNKNGEAELRKFVDFKFTLDERICDGHYYASAIKMMNDYLKHPEKLDEPVEVVPDIYWYKKQSFDTTAFLFEKQKRHPKGDTP